MRLHNMSKEEFDAKYAQSADPSEMVEEDVKLLSTVEAIASASLFENGNLQPQALVVGEDDKLNILFAESFNTYESKDEFAIGIRLVAILQRAKAVIFFSESWGFEAKTPEDLKAFEDWRQEVGPNAQFSEYPGEGVYEIVMISMETRHGIAQVRTFINRAGKDGSPYLTDAGRKIDYWTAESLREKKLPFSGRFVNLLPPPEMFDNPAAKETLAVIGGALSGMIKKISPEEVGEMQAAHAAKQTTQH